METNNRKKLKYALITTVDTTMSWFMVPYAYYLKERGYDVSLICNASAAFLEKYSNDFNCINIPIQRGIHIGNLFHSIKNFKSVIKRERFDVVEYGTENASFVAALTAKLCKVKVRIYNHWGILYIGFKGLKRFFVKQMEKIIVANSTDVRQVSNMNLEYCRKHHLYPKNKGIVLGKGGTIGVDATKFDIAKKESYNIEKRGELNIPMNAFVIGFTGRIQKDKGVNELIESFKRLLDSGVRNTYLLLVGGIDEEKPIEKENMEFAKESEFVKFSGYTTMVEKYISCFDMMVHPTYREGFGMVLQEAGALKTAIITTNIPGPSEFIKNDWNGLLVEPKNADELYMAMVKLYKDKETRARYANTCYDYVMTYFERKIMISRMYDDRANIIKERLE